MGRGLVGAVGTSDSVRGFDEAHVQVVVPICWFFETHSNSLGLTILGSPP